jgi:Tol biopolymer transport system component
LLSFLFVILIDLAEESQSRKRIEKEPKVKTEIDVGTQGWQDLDVKQLLESESWREVESHQVFWQT